MAEPRFIHLRVHSDFSMVDGLQKIKPLVARAAEHGMPAMAITDQMNQCGLVRFYGEAHGKGMKPLAGVDFWVQSDELGEALFRLTGLAMDNEGQQNLVQLISKGYLRGHVQGLPVIDKQWLVEHQAGVILLSGGREGDVGKFLLKGNEAMVARCVAFYQHHFADRFYLELIRTGRTDEETYIRMAVALAQQADLRLQDYRDVDGQYDFIVSIEMLEAVGERWWPSYFAKLRDCLKPGGKALVQVITMADEHFDRYRSGTDFIQQYIFPGGMLPSPSRLQQEIQRAGLHLADRYTFGADYALTLRAWLARFEQALPQVRHHGFDDGFIRLWQFYLYYCIAAFEAGRTDVCQLEIQRRA